MGEWISAKDRAPDKNGNYLGVVDGRVMLVTYGECYERGTYVGKDFIIPTVKSVTHWMPLPEPPEEG